VPDNTLIGIERSAPPCRTCGSTESAAYINKPPRKHNGPCTSECLIPGQLCLNCRMFTPDAPQETSQ
jgi:hypothetical protein